jgi:hypothetical protein
MSEDPIVVAEKLSFLFQCFDMWCSQLMHTVEGPAPLTLAKR